MVEGTSVAAGEAILSAVSTVEHGQEALLERLVRQHSRLVYRIAYAVLRRHQDAEDATQETFLRVLRYNSKMSAVKDQKTWLARIVWRVAIDRSKQRDRRSELPLETPAHLRQEVASSAPGADRALNGLQLSTILEQLIAALPGKLREPLILSTLEEMSPSEVAATLGITEAAVRARVFRARRILRDKLAAQTGWRSQSNAR
jgi:RNA polymerase sigma-70 factor, ECF subfamily